MDFQIQLQLNWSIKFNLSTLNQLNKPAILVEILSQFLQTVYMIVLLFCILIQHDIYQTHLRSKVLSTKIMKCVIHLCITTIIM